MDFHTAPRLLVYWYSPPRPIHRILTHTYFSCSFDEEKNKIKILGLQALTLGLHNAISRAGHSLFISRFALRSPLILYPWIAIALALILPIFRFAHRSISQKDQWFTPKKTVVRSRSQAVNRLLLCSLGWYS